MRLTGCFTGGFEPGRFGFSCRAGRYERDNICQPVSAAERRGVRNQLGIGKPAAFQRRLRSCERRRKLFWRANKAGGDVQPALR
ncbi:MAG: hypothetical protein JOZ39_11435 [Chloroflexi bacterium]|nr:hypothetical protein [Chloroflexota bacterium]